MNGKLLCRICKDDEFSSPQQLYAHIRHSHKMRKEDYVIKFIGISNCVICQKPSIWNKSTGEFNATCSDKSCISQHRSNNAKKLFTGDVQSQRIKKLYKENQQFSETHKLLNQEKVKKAQQKVREGWQNPDSKYYSEEFQSQLRDRIGKFADDGRILEVRSNNMTKLNETGQSSRKPYIAKNGKFFNMRSKREVAYAFMLDNIGLEWHYEPKIKNKINSYIPDFLVIYGSKRYLIELHKENDVQKQQKVMESQLPVIWIDHDDIDPILEDFFEVQQFKKIKLSTKESWGIVQYFFEKVKIKSVEQLEEKREVFDLVEPEHKLFITNSIFTYDTVNFGILYGKTSHGLAIDLNVSQAKAQEMIDGFFAGFPLLRDYFEDAKKSILREGCVYTRFGRRIIINDWNSSNKGKLNAAIRSGQNATIQSAASDCVVWTIRDVYQELVAQQAKSVLFGSVHDSVEFDLYPGELFQVIKTMKDTAEKKLAESIDWIQCPIEIGVEMGVQWGSAIEMGIKEFSDSHFKAHGKGLRRDVQALIAELDLAYDVKYTVTKEEDRKWSPLDVAYVIRDDKTWEVDLLISKKF